MMKRLLAVIISAFLALSTLVAMPALMTQASADPNVNGAFEDLGRCLQSQGKEKVLDVFYLIDESGSLQATDPKDDRADILSSSLQQLASFKNDVTVNYSVAFFAHSYSVWQPWRTVNKGGIVPEAARLNEEVRKRDKGNLTDWLQGINGAIDELNAQHARTNGCSTLIWLTDGGIQLTNAKKTAEAVVNLCDNRFDVLRKNGVTVLGILLKNDKALAQLTAEEQENQAFLMSLMGPMVIGQGTRADGEEMTCGRYPVPKNYRQGALFVASDPKDLAFEFLKLPPRIEGCANVEEFGRGKDEFEVENGISEFQMVTTATNWSLKDPKGRSLTSTSRGIRVFETAGAAQIKVGTNNSGKGKWSFNGNGGDTVLFYCSGLDIRIDPGTQFISGKAGILSGKVVSQSTGLAADLSKYDSDHPITVELITGGKSGAKKKADQSEPASFMLQNFTPGSGSAEAEVRITLFLKTKRGIDLAPVSISQKIDVRLLSNYPTLKSEPIKLSDMTAADVPAKGVVEFVGPKNADGKVCIAPSAKPIVIQDKVSRADTFEISNQGVDVNGCLPIRQGEISQLTLEVANPVTANSDVIRGVPITYFSDAEPGKNFTLNAEVNFKSGIPGPAGLWKIILTVLGILLPLILIYLLNWLVTLLNVGSQLKRNVYNVKVTPDGGYTAIDGSTLVSDDLDFKGMHQQGDVRTFTDNGFTFKAKVSKLVFPGPWYEVAAPTGHRVITLAHVAPRLKRHFASGKVAPTSDDLAKIWVLQISDNDLAKFDKGAPIPGKLIIFKRANSRETDQYQKVFYSVTHTPGIWREVTRLAEVVKAEAATETPKNSGEKFKFGKKDKPEGNGGDSGNGGGGAIRKRGPRPGEGGGGAATTGTTSIRPGARPSGNSSTTSTSTTSIRPGGSTSSPGATPPSAPPTTPIRPGTGDKPKRI